MKNILLGIIAISITALTGWTPAEAQTYYRNPITTSFGCPDPGVFKDPVVANRFLLSCTGGRFPVRQSDDMMDWRFSGHYLVNPNTFEPWGKTGNSWAPEIVRIGDRIVAYYTQNTKDGSRPAIAVSWTSALFKEPFTSARSTPLLAAPSYGGVIDPSYFKDPDSNKHYLLYKVNGNAVGQETRIKIRQLNANGNSVYSDSRTLKIGGSKMSNLVEGQDLIKKGKYYYLFYSHGNYSSSYKVKVARATNLFGPYTGDRTVLSARSSNPVFRAPGHGKVVSMYGKDVYFYHAYDNRINDNKRYAMIDEIHWKDGWPIINDGHPSFTHHFVPTNPNSFFHDVTFRWNAPDLRNPTYSLDVIDSKGKSIPACLSASIIGSNRSVTFTGDCKTKGIYFTPSTLAKFRICAAQDGKWSGTDKVVKCTHYKSMYNYVSVVYF